MAFKPDELERYGRHVLLKEIGGPGQQRLKAANVAIVGIGGLGAPAALYLAAAGIGRIRLIDPDHVSLSNLQRQILYRAGDVGAPKIERAAQALSALNPNVDIEIVDKLLDAGNADALLAGSNVVLDGSDNFQTRFAVNDSCRGAGRFLVSGAVGRWDGQLTTFVAARPDAGGLPASAGPERSTGVSPCYRCLVPEAPADADTCSVMGVIGPLCGIIGAAMALETIKIITGAGENLVGRLAIFDSLTWRWREARLSPDPDCATCGRDA